MQLRVDRVNAVLRDQITGIRVVRAFVREPVEIERFAVANDELTQTSLRAGRLMALMFPTVTLFISISSVAVLWLGAARIESGDMELGSVVAYLSYLVQVLVAVVMLTFMVSMIPRASVAAERIVEVLDTDSSVTPPARSGHHRSRARHDRLRATSDSPIPGPHSPVLSDISFTRSPGSHHGDHRQYRRRASRRSSTSCPDCSTPPRARSRSTASTSVGSTPTCCGDRSATSHRSRTSSPARWRPTSGSVGPDATDGELWQALEIAQADGFVQSMPDGLDSAITQGGTNVSGGQRQRLSIARALVMRPDLYVFDDSFSALDLATDARLRLALRPHVRDAGVLIVAQRVSTIADADQIIVLDNGRVVGRGRHLALIDTCPTYAEIVDSQFERETA